MDQHRHKTMFHSLISQMEHVFVNGTWCCSLSNRSIVTALAVALAMPNNGSITAIDINEEGARVGEAWV